MESVGSIDCYQCSAASDLGCSDELIQGGSTSCDHVFEARYCIKTTGFYAGGLGTKRFCSSLDLGNYCNYIKQPGDELEYRSCVFTCSTDGCNAATHYIPFSLLGALLLPALACFLQ
uniref:Protein sleepless n=1 Tax=Timema monikensis TaxID=170555 RepID=A0A7R9EDB5_9NEOP|nr:unnamed protein product [Timema monikensis]